MTDAPTIICDPCDHNDHKLCSGRAADDLQCECDTGHGNGVGFPEARIDTTGNAPTAVPVEVRKPKPLSGIHARRTNKRNADPNTPVKKKVPEEIEAVILAKATIGDMTQAEAAKELGIDQSTVSDRIVRTMEENPPARLKNAHDVQKAMRAERAETTRQVIEDTHDILLGPLLAVKDDPIAMRKLFDSNPSAILGALVKYASLRAKIDVEQTKRQIKETAVYIFDMRGEDDWQKFMEAAKRPENIKYVPKLYEFFEKLMILNGFMKAAEKE